MTTQQKALMTAIHAAVECLNGLTREATREEGIIVDLAIHHAASIGSLDCPQLEVLTSVCWPKPGERAAIRFRTETIGDV